MAERTKKAKREPLSPEAQAQRATARAAKLRELSEKRVPVAVKRIGLVGNLAAYKPTEEQVGVIIGVLQEAVNNVRLKLKGTQQQEFLFRLPG